MFRQMHFSRQRQLQAVTKHIGIHNGNGTENMRQRDIVWYTLNPVTFVIVLIWFATSYSINMGNLGQHRVCIRKVLKPKNEQPRNILKHITKIRSYGSTDRKVWKEWKMTDFWFVESQWEKGDICLTPVCRPIWVILIKSSPVFEMKATYELNHCIQRKPQR